MSLLENEWHIFLNVHANVERKDVQGNEETPLDTTVERTALLSS